MHQLRVLVAGLILASSLYSSIVGATASYEDNTLIMPYVVVGTNLYNVNLIYVNNSDPAEFILGAYSAHAQGTETPEGNVALQPMSGDARRGWPLRPGRRVQRRERSLGT